MFGIISKVSSSLVRTIGNRRLFHSTTLPFPRPIDVPYPKRPFPDPFPPRIPPPYPHGCIYWPGCPYRYWRRGRYCPFCPVNEWVFVRPQIHKRIEAKL